MMDDQGPDETPEQEEYVVIVGKDTGKTLAVPEKNRKFLFGLLGGVALVAFVGITILVWPEGKPVKKPGTPVVKNPDDPPEDPQETQFHRLDLSELAPVVPRDVTFYFHDPSLDPGGKLWDVAENGFTAKYTRTGICQLGFARPGYNRIQMDLTLHTDGRTTPQLKDIKLNWEPKKELIENYSRAREGWKSAEVAFQEDNLEKARAQISAARIALGKVRQLDADYRDVAQIILAIDALDKDMIAWQARYREGETALQKGDLAVAEQFKTLQKNVGEVRKLRSDFEQAIRVFRIDDANTKLEVLRNLTPLDDGHKTRQQRLDQLTSVEGVIEKFIEISLNRPANDQERTAFRTRISDLYHPTAQDAAEKMATDLIYFFRRAEYRSIQHKLIAFKALEDGYEIRTRCTTRSTAAGIDSTLASDMVVKLRGNKLLYYGVAP